MLSETSTETIVDVSERDEIITGENMIVRKCATV